MVFDLVPQLVLVAPVVTGLGLVAAVQPRAQSLE